MTDILEQEQDLRWRQHLGRCVEQFLTAGFRYGPKRKTKWGIHEGHRVLFVGQNWHPKLRRPSQKLLKNLGQNADQFFERPPSPVATCSPLVGLFFELALGYMGDDRHAWGQSTQKILKHKALAGKVVTPKRAGRVYSFSELPAPLPAPLCICTYYSHVVLLIDCDLIPVRASNGVLHSGRWVLGADGGLNRWGQEPGKTALQRWQNWMGAKGWKLARVDFDGKPLAWEFAEDRGERQQNNSDKYRLISVRGILRPERFTTGTALVVEA